MLEEALDHQNPLLERVKFFCIVSSNLDEFFEVRVAGLKQQIESRIVERTMDGMTATEILKGDPATCRLKIIALTSFAMRGDREKFLAAGFDGYQSKPISTRELPGLVEQWLNGEMQPA